MLTIVQLFFHYKSTQKISYYILIDRSVITLCNTTENRKTQKKTLFVILTTTILYNKEEEEKKTKSSFKKFIQQQMAHNMTLYKFINKKIKKKNQL